MTTPGHLRAARRIASLFNTLAEQGIYAEFIKDQDEDTSGLYVQSKGGISTVYYSTEWSGELVNWLVDGDEDE